MAPLAGPSGGKERGYLLALDGGESESPQHSIDGGEGHLARRGDFDTNLNGRSVVCCSIRLPPHR